jgi:hypothetical protein
VGLVGELLKKVREPGWQEEGMSADPQKAAGCVDVELICGEVADPGDRQAEQQEQGCGCPRAQIEGVVGQAAL